jgi:hypothetical protein
MNEDDELVHYWWRTGRLVACDSFSPRGTTIQAEVTCKKCLRVIGHADDLAAACGCRHMPTHLPLATIQYRLKIIQ